jgi:hypothetical protein
VQTLIDFFNFSQETLLYLTAFSVLTFLISLIMLPWLILALPSDYFVEKERHPLAWKHGGIVLRLIILFIKNLLGYVLFFIGLALLVLPGQGILTLLAALILMDFPGKFLFLRGMARREHIQNLLNWIRHKGNKEHFVT